MAGHWFTVSAAAEVLGVTRQAVLRLIGRGTLAARRHTDHGRPSQWFVDGDSLEAYAATGLAPSEALTVFDVSVLHHVAERTVRGWVERGLLPAVAHRGQLWIDEQAALDFTPPARGRPRAVTL